ncbi:hypothetical protein NKI77_26515 [Mesorhizobium opportunistum]|uniref:Transmembrane protein n=1 Tax=Mesorhizobium opportunistum TaxID=593909 RepID=A0ABV1YDK5_9HYPH|nr:hypothetical protein [Mesorhizobium sp.]TIN97651.1 MAG: hypothetical protein E5Y06_05295 [Mesorhizobium sp.]TJU98913.1 MAG: hypothetical protein E5Y08_12365 [Mesorhizobium sp.]TJV14583.1 MAG: hypothetical protein E5Y07_25995 [Mesorhizobium sp.]
MIEVVWSFWSRNIRRNIYRIVATTHPYLSGIMAILIAYDYFEFGLRIKLFPAGGVFVSYDTVVFGFTATAIALAIAIPSPTFIKFLSSMKDKTTPFRDFLFILSWNGFVHISAFFISIPIIILGYDWELSADSSRFMKLYVFIFLWLQFYAAFQFMVTTLAVYELGDLYAKYVAKEKRDEEANTKKAPPSAEN